MREVYFFSRKSDGAIDKSLVNEMIWATITYDINLRKGDGVLGSLGIILVIGFTLGETAKKIKLPTLVGYLIAGILLGSNVLNILDGSLLDISGGIRNSALIIILIRAGLSLNLEDLKKVGRPALLLSFIPAIFEITGYALFGTLLFNIHFIEALVIGSILSAVSPAVVVPRMVDLIEKRYGTKKGIPQMILAAASLDDVFVIVLFTAFLGLLQEGNVALLDFINVPLSIVLGVIGGAIAGFLLAKIFNAMKQKDQALSTIVQAVLVLSFGFILYNLEEILSHVIAFSGLIAVMSMGVALMSVLDSKEIEGVKLSQVFHALWIPAQILLFALVGAAVNIQYTLDAGLYALLIIFLGLVFRTVGVYLSLLGASLNRKEKMFVIFSYLPKATVQAAIGGVPLALGLAVGPLALSISVVGILVTAPLGAFLMDATYQKLLDKE